MVYKLLNNTQDKLTILEQVFFNRGFNSQEQIYKYINVSKKDCFSPELLDNIDKGIFMLLNHLKKKDNIICLVVDPDCDGFTSSVLLLNYLYTVFPSCVPKIKYFFHKDKIHGISGFNFPEKTSLIIAPDSSSNEFEIHKKYKDQGVDILILDHHEAEKVSDNACVINNQLCNYPNKFLSGVGIVCKFCERIDEFLNTDIIHNFYDLVMLGLIGDMMDSRELETRYYIKSGLENIKNEYIIGILKKNEYYINEKPNSIDMAFNVIPMINAIMRIGTEEEKNILFNSMLINKSNNLIPSTKRGCQGQLETILEQSLRISTNVKSRQNRLQKKGIEILEKRIEEQDLLKHKILLVIVKKEDDIPSGIRGLIANNFMAKYKRPTLILAESEYEGQKAWIGSARGCENSALSDFKDFCQKTNLTFLTQGHPNAFGFGILDINLSKFIEKTDEILFNVDFLSNIYNVDYIFNSFSLDKEKIKELSYMKQYWGKGFGEPLVALSRIKIKKDNIFLLSKDRKPTIKIKLPKGIEVIKFKSSVEEYEKLLPQNQEGIVIIDIIGTCSINTYGGKETPQIILEDYEIIDKKDYDF